MEAEAEPVDGQLEEAEANEKLTAVASLWKTTPKSVEVY